MDEKRRRVQLTGDPMGPAEESERGLQMDECARITRKQSLVDGQAMPGVVIPQLESRDAGGPGAGTPEPAADLIGADVQREERVKASFQSRRRRSVAVGQEQGERVQQKIGSARWVRTWRRGPRGFGRRSQFARDPLASAPHRASAVPPGAPPARSPGRPTQGGGLR